jgi:Mn-containing catalase
MPGSGREIACNSVADIATGVVARAAAHANRFQKALDSLGK